MNTLSETNLVASSAVAVNAPQISLPDINAPEINAPGTNAPGVSTPGVSRSEAPRAGGCEIDSRKSSCRPYFVGAIRVDPPVVLAPMADVTNGPFRRLCKRIGQPGLIVTEQISTMAIHYRSERTFRMFDWTAEEQPLSVQLFGADPVIMAEAARIVVDRGASIVDINMGCWVPKICKQGAGAALLKDEATAIRVVEAILQAVPVPVTVKMRAGWNLNSLTSTRLARALEGIGVSAFALHARTATQGYHGEADWRWIAEIKSAVSVPVVGNGDVRTPQDAARMLQETGCDGVMIGRAAIGNPWILRDVAAHLVGFDPLPPPTLEERVAAAMEHLEGLAEEMGEKRAVCHLRGQIPHYFKGFRGASEARDQIVRACSIAELQAIMDRVIERQIGEGIKDREDEAPAEP